MSATGTRIARPRTMPGSTIATGPPGRGGYRRLLTGPPEPLAVRTDLGGARPGGRLRPLVAFAHLTDLHVADVQSPARAEFLDRLGDPDSPHAPAVGRVGTYRAQEALTYQVVEAMARAVQARPVGPATGTTVAFAVSTGDATDNCQANELEAYLTLLDGGRVVEPDSGDRSRFEGVGCADAYDRRYHHPDGTPEGEIDDLPRARHGFPLVPGLLDACRVPFRASGLGLPWYAVYGNHDALFGGTLAPDGTLTRLALGGEKPVDVAETAGVVGLLLDNETSPSAEAWGLLGGPRRAVAPDPGRRPVGAKEWIAAHLASPGAPRGHGFDALAVDEGRAYYGFDAGPVRFLVLDTVNRAGGWQGSIDADQLDWLEEELMAGHRSFLTASGRRLLHDAGDRLFVLLSHHPLETLVNGWSPDGGRRHLRDEVASLLARFPNVVCWVNGHTHENAVTAMPATVALPGAPGGFWQVTTASHIDWPQQSRLVELALDETTGDLVVAATMLDHAGALAPRGLDLDGPLVLAGWSRELSANAWQGRASAREPLGRGGLLDRNVALVVPAPFPVTRR